MVKTESDIERDFMVFVRGSELGASIHGGIYRSEMRPADAVTEDIVVKFLAGVDSQVQTGVVIINVYVPDVHYGANGRMVADKARIATLQSLIRDFVDKEGGTEYLLHSESTPTTVEAEDINQHIICARVYFQRITN